MWSLIVSNMLMVTSAMVNIGNSCRRTPSLMVTYFLSAGSSSRPSPASECTSCLDEGMDESLDVAAAPGGERCRRTMASTARKV
ncbi:hypothetical protein [Streptomyces sp. NPDC003393]